MHFFNGADTTKPSPRVHKSLEELQLWKCQIALASHKLELYTKSTCDLGATLDRPLYAFPRVYELPTGVAGPQNQAPVAVLKSGYERMLGPADKMASTPSSAVMANLAITLSRDVHKPIKAWYDRYKALKKEVNGDLEALRKKFDASSAELIKAMKAQDKERKKDRATLVDQMQSGINVKEKAREDIWKMYCNAEEEIHKRLEQLAEDARQASGHLTKAAAAIAAAMSQLAQRFAASGGPQQAEDGSGGPVSSPLVGHVRKMSLNSGTPHRRSSADGEQAAYGQRGGGCHPGRFQEEAATMGSAVNSDDGGTYAEANPGSFNFDSAGGGAGDRRFGSSIDGGSAQGQEPWAESGGVGGGRHSRASSASSSQGVSHDGGVVDGYVAIGAYGVPLSPPSGFSNTTRPVGHLSTNSTARRYMPPQHGQANGGSATAKPHWASPNSGPSAMGYTRSDLRISGQSDASDVSLAAAAAAAAGGGGGVVSPGTGYGVNSGMARMTIPRTRPLVDTTSELGDEETPAAEKGVKGPFARQLF